MEYWPILFLLVWNLKLAFFAGFESITDPSQIPINSIGWCYDENHCNESTWVDHCRRKSTARPESESTWSYAQSPVNINTSRIRHREFFVHCINYKSFKGTFRIQFKGYTVQIEFENAVNFGIYNSDKYDFHGLHLHWGHKDDVGSEHTINEKSFPIEIHFLAYNQEYKTMDAAVRNSVSPASIAAYAVLVDVVPFQSGLPSSQVLAPIVKRLSEPDPTVAGPEILDLADLFQSKEFYWYLGTFTSPGCNNVWWNIMVTPLLIPKEHLEAIRALAVGNPKLKGNNFRSLKSSFHKRPSGTTVESFPEKIKLLKCQNVTCEKFQTCLAQSVGK